MRRILSSLLLASLAVTAQAADPGPVPVYSWTTLAGRASLGREDGVLTQARFNQPSGLARLIGGDLIVADRGNHTIRSISPGGVVSTIAGAAGQPGSTNGPNATARFNGPRGVGIDGSYNIYVTDTDNCVIRRISQGGGVSTYAGQLGQHGTTDGPAAAALFDNLNQIAVDLNGNVYVSDHGIRKISHGNVTTVFSSAQMIGSAGRVFTVTPGPSVAVDSAGQVYFSARAAPWDGSGGLCIVKLDAAGNLSFAVGPESLAATRFDPYAAEIGPIAFDPAGKLYFTNLWVYYYGYEQYLTRVDPGGPTIVANINNSAGWGDDPLGLAVDANGWLLTRGSDDTIAGQNASGGIYAGTPWSNLGVNGTGAGARFAGIDSLAIDPAGNLWALDAEMQRLNINYGGYGVSLRKITPAGQTSTSYAQYPIASPPTYPGGVAADGAGNIYYGTNADYLRIFRLAPDGTTTNLAFPPWTRFFGARLAANSAGTVALIQNGGQVDQWMAGAGWSLLAGPGDSNAPIEIKDGTGLEARFGRQAAVTADRAGDFYVLDTIPGDDNSGGVCYLRKVTTAGVVTTLSGNLTLKTGTGGPNSDLMPRALALDSHGSFFLTYADHTVRQLTSPTGDLMIIGGTVGVIGSLDGNSQQSLFWNPSAVRVDAADNLYVVDARGETIRKGQYLGISPTVTAHPLSQSVTAGGSITIGVTASATPAPTYQWFHNGAPVTGATGPTLTVSNFRTADVGDYTVNVTNPFGTVTSNGAVLTLSATPPPAPLPASSSGGGGAVSPAFLVALLALGLGRGLSRR